jgi:hypothetical protein
VRNFASYIKGRTRRVCVCDQVAVECGVCDLDENSETDGNVQVIKEIVLVILVLVTLNTTMS